MKKRMEQKQKWLQNEHGKIHELKDEKDFFQAVKSTNNVVCLFYSKTSKWCNLLAEHLAKLAQKHLECKFLQINSENVPYLIENLNIWMMPTLVLAKNNKVDRQLIGLDWCAPDGKMDTVKIEKKLFEYGFFEDTYMDVEKQNKDIKKKTKRRG